MGDVIAPHDLRIGGCPFDSHLAHLHHFEHHRLGGVARARADEMFTRQESRDAVDPPVVGGGRARQLQRAFAGSFDVPPRPHLHPHHRIAKLVADDARENAGARHPQHDVLELLAGGELNRGARTPRAWRALAERHVQIPLSGGRQRERTGRQLRKRKRARLVRRGRLAHSTVRACQRHCGASHRSARVGGDQRSREQSGRAARRRRRSIPRRRRRLRLDLLLTSQIASQNQHRHDNGDGSERGPHGSLPTSRRSCRPVGC